MRSSIVGWRIAVSLLAGVTALALSSGASAQDKIAPSRSYGGSGGGAPGATYIPTLKQHPDKNFGTPDFGRKGSGMPAQQGLNAGDPPAERPGQPKTGADGIMPDAHPSVAALPAPGTRPGTDAVPSSSAQTDFFAAPTDFNLRKPRSGGDTSETPLFTTQDGTDSASGSDQGD